MIASQMKSATIEQTTDRPKTTQLQAETLHGCLFPAQYINTGKLKLTQTEARSV